MSPVNPARRRAERFDSLVEGTSTSGTDAGTAELLELVGALRQVPHVEPRADFVLDLRERLMLAAETEMSPAAATERKLTVTPRRTPRERRIAVALGGVALVGATTSMAVAAQGALPGDVLYPLKRAIESAETGIKVDDSQKGNALLSNARGRLDEIDRLADEGDSDPQVYTTTLDTFSDQATQAGDLLITDFDQTGDEQSINRLRDFAATSIASLSALEDVLPPAARDALLNAAETIFTLDAAAQQACPGCSAAGITDIPTDLLSSASHTLTGLGQAVAGATGPLAAPTKPAHTGGGKGPRKDPAITAPPSSTPSSGSGNPLDLPTPSSTPTQQPSSGGLLPGVLSGGGHHTHAPASQGPLTTAVSEAVDDIVDGVDGLLGGLGQGLAPPANP